MSDELIVNGIVLYSTLVGEYDKRLVVLTKERGKITIFANGARRPNSQFRVASQSFVMGTFTITSAREAYNLRKAEISEYFGELQLDMEKMCYASYFCELMSYYTREGDSCVNNLNLLYLTLKTLIKSDMDIKLVKAIYETKLMDLEGQGISSFTCIKCKSKELGYYNPLIGGLICPECARKSNITYKVSEALVYTLQFILSSPIGKIYSFKLTDQVLEEFVRVVDTFVNTYVDKKFKSLEILSSLA